MKKKLTIAAMLATTLLLAACGKQSTSQSKKTATFGLNTEVASLDTLKAQDPNSFDVQDALVSGLYRMNAKDQVKPDIAKGMPTKSNGNKTYTINLRHNAKWSNGAAVTANDFVYAWTRGANPATKSNYAYIIQTIVKNGDKIATGKMKPSKLAVKALGKYRLQVTLQKPTPYFTSLLSFNPYFPQNQKFVEKQGNSYATSPKTMLSNGPFKLKSYRQGTSSFSLTRNKNYVGPVKPRLNQLNFNIIKDAQTGLSQYEGKKLDMTFLTGNLVKNNQNKAGFKTIPNSMVTYLEFNFKKGTNNDFRNKNFRTAIANAVDTKQLATKILQDKSSPLTGYIPPKFVKNTATGKDFRAEGGKLAVPNKNLVQANWQRALKQFNKRQITIQLLVDDEDWQKTTAQYLQSELQSQLKGLKIEIRSLPQQQELGMIAQGKF
ncbi:peptide ABC transporter substrate-binding protein [Lentilactobacillus fungorum]|uniref:Peptide ABC transporter substrate-binding protein n=1 Tax=Lentilactobacillus fungorum TaxID=2201250 RepID=A0ABQ3W0A1_9LACO|nr:peptide ABC transporter substrate-binding protein [Lentilactobacillus fungorum]GHP13907.1 peptide ABC transporter substrate-binding protein [Lentilactobacillus fungorum]